VEGDGAAAELGGSRTVEAVVSLGTLSADDVDVQLVHGPVGQGDELTERTSASMHPAGAADEDHARYVGSFHCERAGRYGFTVRIVPRHPDLVDNSELGLAAWA
jgi:starch phosphorylase